VGKIRQAATTGQGEFPTNSKKITASNGCTFGICVLHDGLKLTHEELALVNDSSIVPSSTGKYLRGVCFYKYIARWRRFARFRLKIRNS
jgi:hypothetical protein